MENYVLLTIAIPRKVTVNSGPVVNMSLTVNVQIDVMMAREVGTKNVKILEPINMNQSNADAYPLTSEIK